MIKKIVEKEADSDYSRIDVFLSKCLNELTRSEIKRLIKEGFVELNGEKVKKASVKVKKGDKTKVYIPEKKELRVIPQEIPLDIIYEDEDIVVLNKPSGMVVHPGAGNFEGTLSNALISRYPDIVETGAQGRPGIVHRLDKDTSGVIIVARNKKAMLELQRQFKEREVKKSYIAVVRGNFKEKSGVINLPIGRSISNRKKYSPKTRKPREAVTEYKVLFEKGEYSLVEARPKTGRTHQIRVHFASKGHPIVGDSLYSRKKEWKRLLLHARLLTLKHPSTGQEMLFYAPPPKEFYEFLRKM